MLVQFGSSLKKFIRAYLFQIGRNHTAAMLNPEGLKSFILRNVTRSQSFQLEAEAAARIRSIALEIMRFALQSAAQWHRHGFESRSSVNFLRLAHKYLKCP